MAAKGEAVVGLCCHSVREGVQEGDLVGMILDGEEVEEDPRGKLEATFRYAERFHFQVAAHNPRRMALERCANELVALGVQGHLEPEEGLGLELDGHAE